MPGASYVGALANNIGDWPSGKGASGYTMRDSSYATVESLPPEITSFAIGTGAVSALNANPALPKWLALPGGASRTLACWYRRLSPPDPGPYYILDLPGSTVIDCAQYSTTGAGNARLVITSEDGLTTYLDTGVMGVSLTLGCWLYYQVWGPGRLKIAVVDTNVRIAGLLFDVAATTSPGRLLCFEPGRTGLTG